jgi:hypothetical protein
MAKSPDCQAVSSKGSPIFKADFRLRQLHHDRVVRPDNATGDDFAESPNWTFGKTVSTSAGFQTLDAASNEGTL